MKKKYPIGISVQQIYHYPFDFHTDEIRILFILKGSVDFRFVSSAKRLREQDIEIININEPVELSSSEDNVVLIFSIDRDFAQSRYPNIDKIIFNCNFDYIFPSRLSPDGVNDLKRYISDITSLYLDDTEKKRVQIEKKTIELLDFLVEDTNSVNNVFKDLPNADLHTPRFQHINEYILNHLNSKVSLTEIANNEYVSLQYLSSEFKKKYNISFNEMVNYYRVIHSVRLLLKTSLSITEIADRCGFSATRYYYKYFSKYLHVSPNEFRKANLRAVSDSQKFRELNMHSTLAEKGLLPADHTLSRHKKGAEKKRVLIVNPDASGSGNVLYEALAASFSDAVDFMVMDTSFGPSGITDGLDDTIAALAVLETLLEQEGTYDGVLIAGYFNCAVKAARDILSVPILGPMDAVFHWASLFGKRFSIITANEDEKARWIKRNAAAFDEKKACVSVKNIEVDFDNKNLSADVERAVRTCRDADDADLVLFASAALFKMCETISQRAQIPVIDGFAQAAVLLEVMMEPALKTPFSCTRERRSEYVGALPPCERKNDS